MSGQIFHNKKLNSQKLIMFGFKELDGKFVYSAKILDGEFILDVEIQTPNIVKTKLTESISGEIYTLHLTDSEGNFVGKVREEYTNLLKKISSECFEPNVFRSNYAHKIIEYVKTKYNDEIEYLWEKFPDNAIARRKDNSKWYLAILTVKKDRLGFESDEKIEIIDLRAQKDKVPELLDEENIYPAYHMNKKSWITIILDGSVNIDKIFEMIDISYNLAKK